MVLICVLLFGFVGVAAAVTASVLDAVSLGNLLLDYESPFDEIDGENGKGKSKYAAVTSLVVQQTA